MMDGVRPITDDERRARMEKARRLMRDNKLDAILCAAGSSLFYFTGSRYREGIWVLPAKGEPVWYRAAGGCGEGARGHPAGREHPGMEPAGGAVRGGSRRALAASDKIGIEERVPFAVFDGLRRELPRVEFVSADPVTVGCRVIKSPAEIALMQRANDITIAGYKAAFATLREGMTNRRVERQHRGGATARSGRRATRMVDLRQVHRVPARPIQPQALREGDMVLVDDGCTVDGLPIGHHAHHGIRQADGPAARDLGPGAQGAGRGAWRPPDPARRANRWTPPRGR